MAKVAQDIRPGHSTDSMGSQIPLSNISTPSSQKLMPPPALPSTQNQQANGSTPGSNKRRRRRRGGARNTDSFSETATTVSENGNRISSSPFREHSTSFTSTRPTLETLAPTMSQEEQAVFEHEPEMFGVYASTSEDEGSTRKRVKKFSEKSPRASQRTHSESQSKSVAVGKSPKARTKPNGVSSSSQNQIARQATNDSWGSEPESDSSHMPVESMQKSASVAPSAPQVMASQSQSFAIPTPIQLDNGKFPCPLADDYDCDQNFASIKSAKRHALRHVKADEFKCDFCEKAFSRKDTLEKHLKMHQRNSSAAVNESIVPEPVHEAEDDSAANESNSPIEAELTPSYPVIPSSLLPPDEQQTEAHQDSDEGPDREQLVKRARKEISVRSESESEATSADTDEDDADPSTADNSSKNRLKAMSSSASASKSVSSDSEVSAHAEIQPRVAKRKRTASISAKETSEPARKTARRNPSEPARHSLDDSDEDEVDHVSQSDVDMNDAQSDASSEDVDSSPDDTEETSQLAIRQKNSPTKAKIPGKNSTLPKEPILQRQSSMDSFVHRESSTPAPVQPSSSKLGKVSINVPQRKQTKLTPNRTRRDASSFDDKSNDKGKARAVESDEDSESPPPPKATKTARRTMKSSQSTQKPRTTKKKGASARNSEHEISDSIKAKRVSRSTNGEVSQYREPSGRTGRFTEKEVSILLSWRDSFCTEHDITPEKFNDMMTASMRRGEVNWPYKFLTKKDFLTAYRELLPDRNIRSMNRFRERHFQNVTDKPWTDAEDTELKELVHQLGSKWVEIGQLMERTADSVSQRWRHKLNYGNETQTGDWSAEDIAKLEQEIKAFAASKGMDPDDETLAIPWQAISLKVGNGRTPQQCSNRWRVSTTRRVGPKFVKIDKEEREPGTLHKTPRERPARSPKPKQDRAAETGRPSGNVFKSPKTPSKTERRLAGDTQESSTRRTKQRASKFKSDERVMDSGTDDDVDSERQPAVSQEQQASNQQEQSSSSDEDDADSSDIDTRQAAAQQTASVASGNSSDAEDAGSESESSQPAPRPQRRPATNKTPRTKQKAKKQSPGLSGRTPAVSKNPIRGLKTPGQEFSLTQLHDATQADSSQQMSSGQKSRVPDTVVEPRPSPGNSIRRRPVSSPLAMLEPIDKSPSYKSARSDGGETSQEEASSNDDDDDVTDGAEEDPTPSQGVFWQAVNSMLKPFGTKPTPSTGKKRKTLVDTLTQGTVDDDDDDDDDTSDD